MAAQEIAAQDLTGLFEYNRDRLMACIGTECGGNTTIENILSCIGRGVCGEHILALQFLQRHPERQCNSLYNILPDEVATAIEDYEPRPAAAAPR